MLFLHTLKLDGQISLASQEDGEDLLENPTKRSQRLSWNHFS